MIPKLELTPDERRWIYENADCNGWLFEWDDAICVKLIRCGQGVQKTYNRKPGIELRGQIYLDWQGYRLSQLLGTPIIALASR